MKSTLAILLFGSLCNAAPISISPKGTLNIEVKNGEVEVSLPAEAKKALTSWNPEFVVSNLKDYNTSVIELFKEDDPKSVPMAFIADFSNNGEKGIALMGADLHREYAVAVVKKKKQWVVIELQSWPLSEPQQKSTDDETAAKEPLVGNTIYVTPAIGEHATKLGKKVGIQVEVYLGPGSVYEIKDGKASQVILKK